MSWAVEVKPTAEKQYRKLDKKTRARVLESLRELERLENPLLHQNMRPLTGELKGDWRLRVGDWRVLITTRGDTQTIYVYALLPRGGAY